MDLPQNKPLISVILPVYNGAAYIGAALQSATSQTYRNLEVIVVDDGSTDGTRHILEAYAAADPRVRVLRQANAGVAHARNRAIAVARGHFIAPLDADDLWVPEKLERQMERMLDAGQGTGLVYCWWAWIDVDGAILDRSPRWHVEGNVLKELICINFVGNASVPLFRRHCLEEMGGYNPALSAAGAGGCEDWEVVLRIAARFKVACVPEVLLGYRRRPGSMSTACATMWRSQQLVLKEIRQLQPGLNPALFRASTNQFSMYLSGLSFWAGHPFHAIGWALRSGIRLPLFAFPYVLKMLLWPRRRESTTQTMQPGIEIETSRIPEPMLPYDRIRMGWPIRWILERPLVAVRACAGLVLRGLQRFFQSRLLARMRREATSSSSITADRKPRLLAIACWHFPIYSQTFVYREVLELASEHFEVRFAYSGLTSRRQLPDDCAALWSLKRRMIIADTTANRDLKHYQRRMPDKVQELARKIAVATGMREHEVFAHRHFRQAFSFARFAEAWRADYIHTYFFYEATLFGFVASSLLGIPRGVSCYADHMMDDYDLKLIAVHMSTSDVVVATSQRIKDELESLAGAPVTAAIVKPNGVDVSRFRAVPRLSSQAGRVMRITAVNRIHPKKGLLQLVEAVALLQADGHRFVLDILGDHDARDPECVAYHKRVKNLVAIHRLETVVTFRGRQGAQDVKQSLEATDIFVAPFVELPNGDKDGIPTALLEAMAAGCTIVSTDAGSILEVIDDGVEGLVVPQHDPVALAGAIARLLKDDVLRAKLTRASRERVCKQFDTSHCESVFHNRVRAVVDARRKQRGC